MINPLAPYLMVIHQRELIEAARNREFAHRVELANPTVPAWRRALAVGAQRLSDGFASAARTIDPEVDCMDGAAA